MLKKPRMILPHLQDELNALVEMLTKNLPNKNKYQHSMSMPRLFPTNTKSGYCHIGWGYITIPLFAFKENNLNYLIWYVSHELAHWYADSYNLCRNNHGLIFMKWLHKICPTYARHYEEEYRPRYYLLSKKNFGHTLSCLEASE